MQKLELKPVLDFNNLNNLNELVQFAQVLPREVMDALKDSASQKGISLEMEVATRLLAGLTQPEAFSLGTLSEQIMIRKFSAKEAFDECKRERIANLFLLETQKLRDYLEFKKKIPRHVKEKFTLIDEVALTKMISLELKEEARRNGED